MNEIDRIVAEARAGQYYIHDEPNVLALLAAGAEVIESSPQVGGVMYLTKIRFRGVTYVHPGMRQFPLGPATKE